MINILSFLLNLYCYITYILYLYLILLVLNQIILNAPKFIPGKKVFATWIAQVNHFLYRGYTPAFNIRGEFCLYNQEIKLMYELETLSLVT